MVVPDLPEFGSVVDTVELDGSALVVNVVSGVDATPWDPGMRRAPWRALQELHAHVQPDLRSACVLLRLVPAYCALAEARSSSASKARISGETVLALSASSRG